MKTLMLTAIVLALTAGAAQADWIVDYYVYGDWVRSDDYANGVLVASAPAPATSNFYGVGAYLFLEGTAPYITVYYQSGIDWQFLGMYGAPYGGIPQAVLPTDVPPISFADLPPPYTVSLGGGVSETFLDEAAAYNTQTTTVYRVPDFTVPEPGTAVLLVAGLILIACKAIRGGSSVEQSPHEVA